MDGQRRLTDSQSPPAEQASILEAVEQVMADLGIAKWGRVEIHRVDTMDDLVRRL